MRTLTFYYGKKADYYAVSYISHTRWDKTLLVVLDPANLIFLRGDTQENREKYNDFFGYGKQTDKDGYPIPEEYRISLFNDSQTISIVKDNIEALLDTLQGDKLSVAYEMLLHINAFLEKNYNLVDSKYASTKEVKALLCNYYLTERKVGDKRSDFYCGITQDVDIRMNQHENEDNKVYPRCCAILCSTEQKAIDTEDLMKKDGFYIGGTDTKGNGAKGYSRFVYLYRK